MSNNWIIVSGPGEAAALAATFDCPISSLKALVVGSSELAADAACGTEHVIWIDTADAPAEDYSTAAAEYLLGVGVDMAMGAACPAARAILGIVGERIGASTISNVIKAVPGTPTTIEHLTIDNRVVETIETPAPAVMLIDPLVIKKEARLEDARPSEGTIATIEQVFAERAGRIRRTNLETAEASSLESASRVIGIGRGVKDAETFDAVSQLADKLDAKIGCTMPVFTDYDYPLESSHYIGLSGIRISPALYFAFGISGTSQHLAGIRNAEKVVCVNKDPQAKFFNNADYGIVGTVEEIAPALAKALG